MKVVFLGTSEFAVPFLRRLRESEYSPVLVITQPDEPSGRKQILQPSPVKVAAESFGLRVAQPTSRAALREVIMAEQPDVCILVAYGRIIPADTLAIPKFGFINAHPSLLPKYRGSSPVQNALLNQDATTGLSLMLLDPEMDQGPILLQREVEINPADTNETLHQRLAVMGSTALLDLLPRYLAGEINPQEQDHKKATYTNIITRENGRINWAQTAPAIEAQLRAFMPWPGIFTTWEGKRLKIKDLSVLEGDFSQYEAGDAFIEPNGYPAVACGQGAVSLEVVQLEGKNEMSGADFVRGYPSFASTKLC